MQPDKCRRPAVRSASRRPGRSRPSARPVRRQALQARPHAGSGRRLLPADPRSNGRAGPLPGTAASGSLPLPWRPMADDGSPVVTSACCPRPRRLIVFTRLRIPPRCREHVMLGLSIRDFDGQAVVALRGELSLADTPGMASHLITAVAACGPSVIVDLAGLDGIGYSGLSVLLRVRKWARRSGGDLPLAAPRQPVRQILQATGLMGVFSVYPSVEEAANSTRQARAWSPEAPPRLRAAMAIRSGRQRPVCRTAGRCLVRPLPRRGMCRSQRIARDACFKRRSPGGTTTACHD